MRLLRRISIAIMILLAGVAAQNVKAQFDAPKFLKASASAPKNVEAGKAFTVTVEVTIDHPYHIQANPTKDGYIATELEVSPVKGIKIGKVTYPKALETKIGGEALSVYEGKVEIKADVTPERSFKPGKVTLPITLKYQGCDQTKCFPPNSTKLKAVVNVGKARSKMTGETTK